MRSFPNKCINIFIVLFFLCLTDFDYEIFNLRPRRSFKTTNLCEEGILSDCKIIKMTFFLPL